MEQYYTNERNVQIVIGLLKAHGIKRIVASPGSTNVTFVASVQQDPWFEIYSCVDERSAAYMACGIALETGEHVYLVVQVPQHLATIFLRLQRLITANCQFLP